MILLLYRIRGTPAQREAEKLRLDRLYEHRDHQRLVRLVENNVRE